MMSELEKALNAPNHGSLAYLRRFIMKKEEYKKRSSDDEIGFNFDFFAISKHDDETLMLDLFKDEQKGRNFYKYFVEKYPNNTTKLFRDKKINHDDFIEQFPTGVKNFQVKLIAHLQYTEDPVYSEHSGSGNSVLTGWYVASHVSDKHFDSYCGSGSGMAMVC